MDLFEYAKAKTMENESPLASRLRPTRLEEVVGQQHIVGKDKLLYRAIKADKLTSVIFTDLREPARPPLLGHRQYHQRRFYPDQCHCSRQEGREEVVKQAPALGMYGRKTILFIDEIHRFIMGQQDYLLPFCGGWHHYPDRCNYRESLFRGKRGSFVPVYCVRTEGAGNSGD